MWVAGTFLLCAIFAGLYALTFFEETDDQEAETWQLTWRSGMAMFCAFACGSCLGIACRAVELPLEKALPLRPTKSSALSFP
jgi:hypothetical protein